MSVCAAKGCLARVPSSMLMCHKHWFMVPRTLRDRVWRTYRGDPVPGGGTYEEAREAAIQFVELKESKGAPRAL